MFFWSWNKLFISTSASRNLERSTVKKKEDQEEDESVSSGTKSFWKVEDHNYYLAWDMQNSVNVST